MSDSLWPHGLGPARLLCPWDFPGKNSEVGCHSLLQGIFLNQGSNPGVHCGQTLPSEPLQFSSVQSLSRVPLCYPMNRSTPGLPVHHQLLEFTQTHVHWVSDATQPSHPLSSPSLPALNLSQHQGLFKWVSSSHQVAKVSGFQLQHQSFQWATVAANTIIPCIYNIFIYKCLYKIYIFTYAAAAAKSLQSCLTLCDLIDGSPPGSPVPGILQARTLERVAISSSNAWKWKVKVKSLSRVQLLATPWTAAYQAPPSMGFSRQEYWGGLPLPSLNIYV